MNVEIADPQEFVLVALAVWAIGLFLRRRESADPKARNPFGIQGSDIFLMPFSLRSAYVNAGTEYEKASERIANVVFCAVLWLVGVAILSSLVHDYGYIFGGCPDGQHLRGGQGGGEQYCE
jgi:hypothetical protein